MVNPKYKAAINAMKLARNKPPHYWMKDVMESKIAEMERHSTLPVDALKNYIRLTYQQNNPTRNNNCINNIKYEALKNALECARDTSPTARNEKETWLLIAEEHSSLPIGQSVKDYIEAEYQKN